MKTRVLPAVKADHLQDYNESTKGDFNPEIYIFHAKKNNKQIDTIAYDIVNEADSLKFDQNTVISVLSSSSVLIISENLLSVNTA